MADIDVRTFFFTAAVPVCNEGIVEREIEYRSAGHVDCRLLRSSPIHVVREVLATLPTALQSHATQEIGLQSPFAKNLRTHFARFVVLDQPHFNGRAHSNALIDTLRNTDLLAAQPVDQLTCPYILVAIDFDLADDRGAGEPYAYLEELWRDMEPTLRSVFQYCYGFDRVVDAASFARYLGGCRIETTMPFHDYWYAPSKLPTISIPLLVAIPLLGLALPLIAAWMGWLGWSGAVALGILLALLGVFADYRYVLSFGNRPFPAAQGASLRHVLKALYLQQAFTRLAQAQQGRDAHARGAAFRAFLDDTRPRDLDAPTQLPGVIRAGLAGDPA